MLKRGEAPATGRAPVASRTPLSGSGEEWTARRVEGVENGCPWNEDTCAYAAFGGQLEVLQWARANAGPWGASTCMWAAEHGHLEVLQWLHANGCPWDAETSEYAASEGNRSACYGRRYHRDVLL